jgi:WD40 repeat protein
MKPCPGTQSLRGLLDETLAEGERTEVEKHVEVCLACEQILEQLTRADCAFLGEPALGMELSAVAPPGGRFRILRRFNIQGGQGDLFIARDSELERDVAVKKLKDENAMNWTRRGELIREALITGNLEHPGIVPVYGLGFDADGHSYYAMRLVRSRVEGDELDNTLVKAIADLHEGGKEWTLHKLLDRFIAVCNTIQYAHDQGILHCDLKPMNIILGPYGETLVLDWGAARPVVEHPAATASPAHPEQNGRPIDPEPTWLSPAPTLQLTIAYASPEQRARSIEKISRASDVYSLGALLCCLLTSQPPQRAPQDGPEATRDERPRIPRPLRRITKGPRALEAICARALEFKPEDRYASARALAEDVGHWLADEPVAAYREGWHGRLLRLSRRNRAWTQAGAAALVLVTVISVAAAVLVNGARRKAVEMSAEMAHGRGMVLCEQGEIERGVHWLARSLEIYPGDQGDPRRVNLSAWSARLCSLSDYRKLDNGAIPVACDRTGGLLLTVDPAGHVDLQETRTEKHTRIEGTINGLPWAVFSPNGKTVLICDDSKVARLWDTTTGKPASPPLTHSGKIRHAVFSQDGKSFLAGCEDGTVHDWDIATGRPIVPPFRHGDKVVYAVALSSDGRLALTGGKMDGTARLWQLTPGKPAIVTRTMVHSPREGICSAAISPDGQRLLTGGVETDMRARLWSARTGEPIGWPLEHKGRVQIVRFSPDGTRALTASEDGEARLWDAATGMPMGRPMRHRHWFLAAEFSPDGRAILTASTDETARLWDAFTGEPLSPALFHQSPVNVVAWSEDGKFALTGCRDGSVRLWEAPSGRGWGLLASRMRPDIDILAGDFPPAGFEGTEPGAGEGGNPAQPGVAGGLSRRPVRFSTEVVSLDFDRTGSKVLSATSGGAVQLWQVRSGAPVGQFIRHEGTLLKAALRPDGQKVLTAGSDGTARLWDVATGNCLQSFPHETAVIAAAFNPADGGRSIVTGSADGFVRIWDTATGAQLGEAIKHRDQVRDVAFSPDGLTVLSGFHDGSIGRWDARTGERLSLLPPVATLVINLVFRPDGGAALLDTQDGSAKIVDTTTGALLGPPLLHRGRIRAVAFLLGGQIVLTGSDEGELQAWNVGAGRAIGEPLAHPEIFSLAISPDGHMAVIGNDRAELSFRSLLRPLDGEPEQISRRLQVLTGVYLEPSGAIRSLTPKQWEDRRHRFDLQGRR